MRFMVQVRANSASEAGVLPPKELFEAMAAFNEDLVRAGVLLCAEGLEASSKGARLEKTGGKLAVIDGPFAETKELIAGFWLVEMKSLEEAVEWFSRCPCTEDSGVLEIRQVAEPTDFPADLVSPEIVDFELKLRARHDPRGR